MLLMQPTTVVAEFTIQIHYAWIFGFPFQYSFTNFVVENSMLLSSDPCQEQHR